jgi:hypothetical protein
MSGLRRSMSGTGTRFTSFTRMPTGRQLRHTWRWWTATGTAWSGGQSLTSMVGKTRSGLAPLLYLYLVEAD